MSKVTFNGLGYAHFPSFIMFLVVYNFLRAMYFRRGTFSYFFGHGTPVVCSPCSMSNVAGQFTDEDYRQDSSDDTGSVLFSQH
jgi:hypothetical protein